MYTIESHLIDRKNQQDFYGKRLRLCFCAFLRPEKKFSNFQELIDQITSDVSLGRDIAKRASEGISDVVSPTLIESLLSSDRNSLEKYCIGNSKSYDNNDWTYWGYQRPL